MEPTPQQSREVLTSAEAAEFLRISERKLWELKENGAIPSFRVGGQVRFFLPSLRQWISEANRFKSNDSA